MIKALIPNQCIEKNGAKVKQYDLIQITKFQINVINTKKVLVIRDSYEIVKDHIR